MITRYADAAFVGLGRNIDLPVTECCEGRSSGCGATDDKGLVASLSHVGVHSSKYGTALCHIPCVSSGRDEEAGTLDAYYHSENYVNFDPSPMFDVEPLARNVEKG